MGRNKDKFPQLSIIDNSLDIDHTSYTGNRLDKASKDVVASFVGTYPLESEMSVKKGLKQAVEALQEFLGNDKVICTKLLPHFSSSDIFLVWDTENSQFARHEEIESTNQEDGRYVRLALQILSNMQTSYDGKPLGMLCVKLRQLKTLGYKPVLVDAEDALRYVYSDRHTTQQHLLKTLSQTLDTDLGHLLS